MDQNTQNRNESNVLLYDPLIVVRDVIKRWMIILLAALMMGIGAYIHADMSYVPQYSATTTYVVAARGTSSTVFSSLSSTTSMASVFQKLLNSTLMSKAIAEDLGDIPFRGTINASVISDTNLINVTVTASDPRTAFLVSQAIIDHQSELTSLVLDSTALEVLRSPTVPTGPSNRPNAMGEAKRAMALTTLAATALLGVLFLYRKTIRSEAEALKVLNCDCLGELPHEKKHKTIFSRIFRRKSGVLITNPATSFRYVESVRKLRRRVERLMHDRKVIMVTSLLENEGKSTVAANLALALARKHSKVLLIDCDLRKPACYILMDVDDNGKQLSDVICGKLPLADALVCDKKSSLELLVQFKAIRNSGDLLSSGNMRRLLELARSEYDYVVLDLPPMAEVSDAEGMMELADASLLVVRQNAAPSPAVNKAITDLSGGNAKLLGCVVNNVYSSRMFSTQGQGYGYGYGYGYGRYGHYGHYGHYGSKKSK